MAEEPPFTSKDAQIINSFLAWGGIVTHYAEVTTNFYGEND
jgi:hypothetical protein